MALCEAEYLALRYLAGDLDTQEQERYRKHVASCSACQMAYRDALSWTDGVVWRHGQKTPPGRVWRAIRRRIGAPVWRVWVSSAAVTVVALVMGLALGHWVGYRQGAHVATTHPAYLAATLKPPTPDAGLDGHVLIVPQANRMVMMIVGINAPAPGQVYEAWTLGDQGAVPIGTLKWKDHVAWYIGKAQVSPGDQVVVCQEYVSWVGEWMGPEVVGATLPST
ncbi:hypothetical protein TPY_2979 [Sulfobacillus acidophilus TPY]|uniref:Anti-sigma-K factor RskA n=1 Tax=Sulfobacillus acidophilus (strain ATCC 700253 / DSM 10332 / NAL) TaxID=679936 RepID=G8TSN7_SULAD|nr:hypothetical protein TPY_2979 [Sulfobacillus acidophilus TPY]AEW04414.1 Anti-sigma-K factor RskA [Sulfobacillus acidophilus DSM 10332]